MKARIASRRLGKIFFATLSVLFVCLIVILRQFKIQTFVSYSGGLGKHHLSRVQFGFPHSSQKNAPL